MSNLKELTPNCFIVYNQYGYRKLLKKFNVHFRPNDTRWNTGEIYHYNYSDLDVVEEKDGYQRFKNHPVKYPALISVENESFERGLIIINICYNYGN